PTRHPGARRDAAAERERDPLVRLPLRHRRALGGLEQLDDVAGGILEQDLRSARPGDDLVAGPQAGLAKPVDLSAQVRDHELDAVPASWRGPLAIGHRRPAELVAPLSSRRRSARATSANAAPAREMRVK